MNSKQLRVISSDLGDITRLDAELRKSFSLAQGGIVKKTRPRVLVIMNDNWELMLTALRMHRLGAICHTAKNGREAFRYWEEQKVSSEPFDLVIIDREMDWIGGVEFVRLVKSHNQRQRSRAVCIIAICKGCDNPRVVLAEGFNHFIKRPVRLHLATFAQLLLPDHMRVRTRIGILSKQPAFQQIFRTFDSVAEVSASLRRQLDLLGCDMNYAKNTEALFSSLNRKIVELEMELELFKQRERTAAPQTLLSEMLTENRQLKKTNINARRDEPS